MKTIENGVTENTSGGMFQASARKTLDIIVDQCNLLLAAVEGLEQKVKALETGEAGVVVTAKKGKVKNA